MPQYSFSAQLTIHLCAGNLRTRPSACHRAVPSAHAQGCWPQDDWQLRGEYEAGSPSERPGSGRGDAWNGPRGAPRDGDAYLQDDLGYSSGGTSQL